MYQYCKRIILDLLRRNYEKLEYWYHWIYINVFRLGFTQAKAAKIEDISVLYQSNNFLVVCKREDIKVNSDEDSDFITVETQLRYLFPDLISPQVSHGFWFCHRLDYATSGALCLALNKKAARWASKAFRKRYTTKHYIALVRGWVKNKVQHVDIGIGRNRAITNRQVMVTENHPECESPRSATTTVVLLEIGTYDGKPASKILLIPHSGRSHQLRVHCAHIGHLIIGDYTYSNRQDVHPYRMMLHAFRLIIPMKHEQIDVQAQDPFVTEKDLNWKATEIITSYKYYTNMKI